MIKGNTKIELTNVKTGQKKVIEDDNMVTNAMSKMLEQTPFSRWYFSSSPFTNPAPLIDRLCGGILLFSDSIEEDPNNCFTPSGNTMVGNARVNYASAHNVPEFGAYNAEESTWNPETGERKYVYDFTTSKGNGTISCVALTNPFVGYYGLGNHSGKKEAIKVEKISFNSTNWTPTNYLWGSHPHFPTTFRSTDEVCYRPRILLGNYNENCIYAVSNYSFEYSSSYKSEHISSGTLRVFKYYHPLSSFDPMQMACAEQSWCLQDIVNLKVPSEIASMKTSWGQYATVCYDDAIYIVFSNRASQSIPADNDFKVWKISYDLTMSEVITMRNTTTFSILGGNRSFASYSVEHNMCPMVVKDGYLICTTGNRIFKIKLTDSTDVVKFTNLLPENTSSTSSKYFFYKLGDTIMGCDTTGTRGYFALNLKTNEVLPVNSYPTVRKEGDDLICRTKYIPIVGTDTFVIASREDDLTHNYSGIVRNSFMLSTINNLPEPVVKTADLAMKITYTLSLDTSDEQEAGDS